MVYTLILLFLVLVVFNGCSDRDAISDSAQHDTKRSSSVYVEPQAHSTVGGIAENLALIREYDGIPTDSHAGAIVTVIEDTVAQLQESGAVRKIDLQSNRCLFALEEWKKMDSQQKEDIARCLAYYCGLKRGVAPLFWVDLFSTEMTLLCKYVHNRSCEIYV